MAGGSSRPPRAAHFGIRIFPGQMSPVGSRRARRHFVGTRPTRVFRLGVNDALIWGESPELPRACDTRPMFRERPDYSNVVFTFMNRAATALATTHPENISGAVRTIGPRIRRVFALRPQVMPT